MIRLLLAFAAIVCVSSSVSFAEDMPKGEWISLFNGKDLTGWKPKILGQKFGEDADKIFRVEDGAITASYENVPAWKENFGHLFYKTPFSHYRVRIEYRIPGPQLTGGPGWAKLNSGVMLHCQDPATMKLDQDFPRSIEAQFLAKIDDKPRPTMNLCTPDTHVVYKGKLHTTHCTSSSSPTFEGDTWVTAEAEVHGSGRIIHYVNGQVVLEYEKPQTNDGELIDSGYISLQAESSRAEFRKVEVMILDKE